MITLPDEVKKAKLKTEEIFLEPIDDDDPILVDAALRFYQNDALLSNLNNFSTVIKGTIKKTVEDGLKQSLQKEFEKQVSSVRDIQSRIINNHVDRVEKVVGQGNKDNKKKLDEIYEGFLNRIDKNDKDLAEMFANGMKRFYYGCALFLAVVVIHDLYIHFFHIRY